MIALLASLALAFPTRDAREVDVPLTGAGLRGRWEGGADGLYLKAASPGELQVWLAEQTLTDGVLRATLVLGKKPDFTLLFRADRQGGDAFALNAYGVSVEREDLVLYRWALGGVRELGGRITVPNLRERRAIELVVRLAGPSITASAYDADTLVELGTVSATDGALPTGHVGLRAHPAQGSDTRLVAMSVLDTGATPLAAERTAFGSKRWVQVAAADRGKIPTDLGELAVDEPELVVVETDPVGLERLRRLGVDIPWWSADEPYWVRDERYRATRADPGVVVRDGIHLDLSYKNPEMVEQLLLAMASRHRDVAKVAELGRSRQGRPIYGVRVSDNPGTDENEPVVLLVAAHHGGELLAPEYALDALWTVLERRKTDPRVARWVNELELWFVPLVNPDGNQAYLELSTDHDRKNGRDLDGDGVFEPWEGVDLNRNYPFAWGALGENGSSSIPASGKYRGPEPGSEPETQALMRLADKRVPVAVISWHTAANKILVPYTVDGKTSPAPDAAWGVAERMSEKAGRQASGRPLQVAKNLYQVDGTDQDWHRWAHGSLAYIIEGSHHNPSDPEVAAASIRTVRPVFETLLDAVLDGPRLVVQVHDGDGRPVSAVVTLEELVLSEGETWRSRAADGRYDLMLDRDGAVNLHVDAPGFKPWEKRVDVRGVTEVEVELKSARGG
ncbi:MAG: hypothetical protein H6738_17450 [Alphaproteobacteria bacterium]|nr:hypothetical protein [Alphaproteobacteria bacterium]